MNKGELDNAIRRAKNIFDEWNNTTGVFEPSSSYYHEILGVIEDAVHCGAQKASGVYKKLSTEADARLPKIP